MSLYEIVFIGIALGLDTLPIAFGVGMMDVSSKEVIKFSSIIAIFHIVLPVFALHAGRLLGEQLGQIAVYIGAIILILLGLHIVYTEFKGEELEIELSGFGFFILPLSVSVDSLTIGFSLGTLGVEIFEVAIFFGAVAFLISILGITIGDKVGPLMKRAGLVSGLILIILGVRMFFAH